MRWRWYAASYIAYVSIRQHTSAYVSIRQHTSAYVSKRTEAVAFSARLRWRWHEAPQVSVFVLLY